MTRMLKKLFLNFGPSEDSAPLEFELGAVTVLVGPNNSGKSLLPREIEAYTDMSEPTATRLITGKPAFKILEWIEPALPSLEESKRLLLSRQFEGDPYYGPVPEGYIRVGRLDARDTERSGEPEYRRRDIVLSNLLSSLTTATLPLPESGRSEYARSAGIKSMVFSSFVSLFTIRLDGRTRLSLTNPRPAGKRREQARNFLWSLWQDPAARERLRDITYDAFERYLVIDPTAMQQLRIKMSHTPPPDRVEDRLDPQAQEFFDQAEDIADLSDGVKAFTGLTTAVSGTDYRIMLIDEPEAFLHPILARKLGRQLTQLAKDRKGNVLAATHSPDFLMGCIEAGEANVVRLTYQSRSERATARHLRSKELRQIMRDPLLRSTGVLGGLFHEGVVVGEADGDRAIYQEVNQRLLEAKQPGAANTLFLNAYEKSTVRRIVEPLRKMGIPAAAVVDLDIIDDRTFDNLVKSAFVPDSLVKTWGLHRARIKDAFETAGLDMKEVGIEGLPKDEKESARILLDNMAVYGIFVVPIGELERWFPRLQDRDDIPGSKGRWVSWVLELMNTNPELFEIEDKDVWEFVRKIAAWISNPEREGIPG